MLTRKILATLIFALFALAAIAPETEAQTATTFVTGLRSPAKIIYSERYQGFFVSEAGGAGLINNGRVSFVTNEGQVIPVLDGLPSGPAAPNGDPSGPSAIWLDGRSLYIAVGNGNATLAGPAPGSEIPNPNPASPIFSSVLELKLPRFVRLLWRPYQLQLSDQTRLASGETLFLGFGIWRATLRLTADFPDYTPNPRPDVPANVRPSNPFGLVGAGNKLYVADAAQNNIRIVDMVTGQTDVFFTYPPRPNPLPGPPVIDAVPDSLRLFGNSLLVTFLTGFPFPSGSADVRQIDLETSADAQLIGNLRMAIDVLPVASNSFCNAFYTLEFQSNPAVPASGRIQRFDSPTGPPTLVTNTLASPTSLARHPPSGDLFVTEIFSGRITRISFP